MRTGLLFRVGSFWIGAHWSARNRRLCINLVPMVTVWITFKGGTTPWVEEHDWEVTRHIRRKRCPACYEGVRIEEGKMVHCRWCKGTGYISTDTPTPQGDCLY